MDILTRAERGQTFHDEMATEETALGEAGGEQAGFEGPITVLFTRRVRPGGEAEYRAWVEGMQKASKGAPGFLGASTQSRQGESGQEFVSAVRFASYAELRAWEASDIPRTWAAKLPADAVDGEANVQRLQGLEFWFTPPSAPAAAGPSPHKMAIVIFVVVVALVSVLGPLVQWALISAVGPVFPAILRTLTMAALQVLLMTYVIMPRVTRVLGRWLFAR